MVQYSPGWWEYNLWQREPLQILVALFVLAVSTLIVYRLVSRPGRRVKTRRKGAAFPRALFDEVRDRLHDSAEQADEQLAAVVERTYRRGGKVLIPAFALERSQEIIFLLASLFESGRLPEIPVYVDSPMAKAVSDVFERSISYLDEEYLQLRGRIGQVMHQRWLKYTASVEDSKVITASDKPCIVISASGMCEHGRILHHLKHGIGNPNNTIVIVGFQAQHTLGRRLLDGETDVMIFGDWFKRKADVVALNAFSAHADRNELIEYVRLVKPNKLYLVHGEPDQRKALANTLRQGGFKDVVEPSQGEVVTL